MQQSVNIEPARSVDIFAIYVPNYQDGYGDFLFSYKAMSGCKTFLEPLKSRLSINPQFILVVEVASKNFIMHLQGEAEFEIPIFTTEEFIELTKKEHIKLISFSIMIGNMVILGLLNAIINNLAGVDRLIHNEPRTLDYNEFESHKTAVKELLEHFTAEVCKNLSIPEKTPILLLPEYSITFPNLELKLEHYPNISMICSGLGVKEQGIFITDELTAPMTPAKYISYWEKLGEFRERICNNQSIEKYQGNTQLFLEYSRQSCERFLTIQRLYSHSTPKNQDIISIGAEAKHKNSVLKKMTPQLIADGFTKIIFADFNTGEEAIIYESPIASKTYRLIHIQRISHRHMLAFMAVAENLIGVTGDQSFSEAISKGAVIIKESGLLHKAALDKSIPHYFYNHSKNIKLKKLLEIVILKNEITSEDQSILQELFKDQAVMHDYRQVCLKIRMDFNLCERIISRLLGHLFTNPNRHQEIFPCPRQENRCNSLNFHIKNDESSRHDILPNQPYNDISLSLLNKCSRPISFFSETMPSKKILASADDSDPPHFKYR